MSTMKKCVTLSVSLFVFVLMACQKDLQQENDIVASEYVFCEDGATLESNDGNFLLEIPPKALSRNTTVRIYLVQEPPEFPVFNCIKTIGNCYAIDIGDACLIGNVKVNALSCDNKFANIEYYALAYYDESNECWVLVEGRIDGNKSRIYTKTNIISSWRLFYITPPKTKHDKSDFPYYDELRQYMKHAMLPKSGGPRNLILSALHYDQEQTKWCLPTSIAMQVKYYGYDYEFYEVATEWNISPNQYPHGNNHWQPNYIEGLRQAYQNLVAIDPTTSVVYPGTIKDTVENYINSQHVMVFVAKKHAVLIIGYSEDSVYFHDPSGDFGGGNVAAALDWDTFRSKVRGWPKGNPIYTLNLPASSGSERNGAIQLWGLGFERGNYTLEWIPDGRYPRGYFFQDKKHQFPDDPNYDGNDLRNMPTVSDTLTVLSGYITNVTPVSQDYRVTVNLHNRRTNQYVETIADKYFMGVPPYSHEVERLLVDDYPLANLPPDQYSLIMYIRNNAVVQDTIIIHFNLAPSAGGGWQLVYATDFSVDPGWTTNNPARYYWVSSDSTYAMTNLQGSNEYTYTATTWNSNSLKLAFDIMLSQEQWGSHLGVGLYDNTNSVGGNFIEIHFGHDDGGKEMCIWYKSQAGGTYTMFYGNYLLNTWYHFELVYDVHTNIAALVVTERATGTTFGTINVTFVGVIAGLSRIGFTNIGTTPYWTTFTGKIDNVSYYNLVE